MQDQFSRTRRLLGDVAMQKLHDAHVAVFGVGGVGGYVVEVLARSGVGTLELYDNDQVSLTNLNRQLIALHSTLNQYKVDVAAERVKDINPACNVIPHRIFYLPENADSINLSVFDYVVDCIDTVTAKLELIKRCHDANVPILSCMGAANKMDPTAFVVTDINKTSMDPLAKIIRKKLRDFDIHHLKVVYSPEQPLKPTEEEMPDKVAKTGRHVPASNAFVPAAAGIVAGGQIVKDLISSDTHQQT